MLVRGDLYPLILMRKEVQQIWIYRRYVQYEVTRNME